ncbi:MAG: 3-hydroxyacyl-CoA dehydrogenase family protein [Thermoleophilaceae bacterium]|nr:3-hydroxyacyl-CoA dehydrogenase family protein [Thermoleophilaceae bacterium]
METVVWARSDASAQRAREKLGGATEVLTDLPEIARRSTVVVEAVAEDAAVKGELLARIHQDLPSGALLATTTSSLSVTELAQASGRPERFAGLHVFNPVEKMDLIELAFPDATGEEVREEFHALCQALGKTAVEVPDVPGFVVNRLLFPFAFEAVRLAEETGLEPKAIDSCMKLGAAHPLGPLALLDLVGLDVAVAIGESIDAEVPARVRQMVDEGKLGRKSGAGFYEYP